MAKYKRIEYEDDIVIVYNKSKKIVYKGILDFCPYDDTYYYWSDERKCYILPNGYTMKCVA